MSGVCIALLSLPLLIITVLNINSFLSVATAYPWIMYPPDHRNKVQQTPGQTPALQLPASPTSSSINCPVTPPHSSVWLYSLFASSRIIQTGFSSRFPTCTSLLYSPAKTYPLQPPTASITGIVSNHAISHEHPTREAGMAMHYPGQAGNAREEAWDSPVWTSLLSYLVYKILISRYLEFTWPTSNHSSSPSRSLPVVCTRNSSSSSLSLSFCIVEC